MKSHISYLNTDLDLISQADLTELASQLESLGVSPLHVTLGGDGRWHAIFETDHQHAEPEPNIDKILTAIESLAEPLRAIWNQCDLREFNIGYDCGEEPWSFNQGLSPQLLGRMAAVHASLRITLYPNRDQDDKSPKQEA